MSSLKRDKWAMNDSTSSAAALLLTLPLLFFVVELIRFIILTDNSLFLWLILFCFLYQFIEEAERSLHDAIMIVRRALKNSTVVPGGGAIDVIK